MRLMKQLASLALPLAVLPALLAGCAHPDLIDLQTPESAVVERMGPPDAQTALPDGSKRFVYSMQPMSQQVWWLTISADGRLLSKENVLDRKHFALIKPGISTEKDVWNLFGKCAQKYEFRLKNEHAWMYRFLDDGFFYMACWVQFDTKGVVTEVGYTTDPWHDNDHDWF